MMIIYLGLLLPIGSREPLFIYRAVSQQDKSIKLSYLIKAYFCLTGLLLLQMGFTTHFVHTKAILVAIG